MNYYNTIYFSPFVYDYDDKEALIDRAKRFTAEEIVRILMDKAECEYDESTNSVRVRIEV